MKKEPLSAAALLRQKAEEQLKAQTHGDAAPLSDIDTLRLVHELEVHQIELEMQNEELMLARNKAEDASQKFSDLYDFAPSGYLSLSREGIIIELNFNAAGLLGTDRSHLKNKRFGLFVAHETRPTYNLFLETIFENKGKHACEISLEANGNEPTYVYLKGTYVEADDKCLVTMFDITERKKAEVTLKASEENLNEAQHIAKIGSWVWDVLNNRIYWSDELMNINGHDKSKPIPPFEKLEPFYTPESWKLLEESVRNSLTTGEPYELELEMVLPDGKHVFTISRGKVVKDADGKVVKMHGTVQDITDRKQIEEKLILSELRYRDLFSQANEGLLIMTPEGQLFDLNIAFAQMHGYSVDELMSSDIRKLDVLGDKTLDDRANIVGRILGGEVVRFDVEHYYKDGHIFPLSVTASLVNIGGQQYFMAFHQDITERKLAEKAVQDKVKELQHFFDVTIGRELKMIELKQEINELARQLGEEEDRYLIVE